MSLELRGAKLQSEEDNEMNDADESDDDNRSISLDERLFVEKENILNDSKNSMESLRREMNEHVHAEMHENDSLVVSDVEINSSPDISAVDQTSTLLHALHNLEEIEKSTNIQSCIVEALITADRNGEIETPVIDVPKDDTRISMGKLTSTKSSKTHQVLNASPSPLSFHQPNGSVIKQRYIKKAERSLSKQNCDKKRRSSSWSEGSPGFGSIDLIANLDSVKQTKNITSINSKLTFINNSDGKWGWVIVFASCTIMIPIVGVLISYGILINAITNEFQSTKLEAGWVGSMVFGITVGMCPISNVLIKAYGSRPLAGVGIVGVTVSVIVTSFTPTLHLMFLTYSFFVGVFANMVYNSTLTLTGRYFPVKHQALATCLASSGISFGTLIFSPLSRKLVDVVGWRHTYQILAGIVFVVGIIFVPLLIPPQTPENESDSFKPPKRLLKKSPVAARKVAPAVSASYFPTDGEKPDEVSKSSSVSLSPKKGVLQELKSIFYINSYDYSLFCNLAFILWMTGTLLWSNAFLFPIIFLFDYMRTLGIPPEQAAFVLTSYGLSEFAGRVLCAVFAGNLSFSMAYVYAASTIVGGVASFVAPSGKDLVTMYAYSIVAGTNSGIINALMFAATMRFFGNEKGQHVWGYINVMVALGMAFGPAVAGGIYDLTQSYELAFYLGGVLFIVCSGAMLMIPPVLRAWPIELKSEESDVEKNTESVSNVKRRRARKRSFRKRSEESLRRKVLRLSVTKEVPNQSVQEAKENVAITNI